jgi:type II secretory pathway component PulF
MRNKLRKSPNYTSNTNGSRQFGYFLGQECTHSISIGLLFSSFLRRTCLALVLLVVAVVLTGCDAFYDLTIENNRNQEVVVRVTGLGDFRMRPCSVQINSTVSSPLRGSIQV